MALAPEPITSPRLERYFTRAGVHPYDELTWARRDARIENLADGSVVFHQADVEFPTSWSANAANIVAQKYFRGPMGTPERESSLRQVIDRVVSTIVGWGLADGAIADGEADAFGAELTHLLVTQKAAFNSPVWFNIGVPGVPQQSSACFILSVEDEMGSILDWYAEEGMIFKGGSGAGVNLSRIRGSAEQLRAGGTASGPVSFMRGADASAGTIKSGGTTRRAAKMVVLDADHPDVEDFIWCKAREERKARVLRDAGFDMDLDGIDAMSIQYQNANNSVRLSDEFMTAVDNDQQWDLVARTTGEAIESLPARELFRQVAEAAWECADPGVQFATTINRWHTAPTAGPITASNPCSEYVHLEDSACNLASLNLLAFGYGSDFDVEGFSSAVRVMIWAQEILVGNSHYPTDEIGATTRRYRQLGLGYTNLGASLMAAGVGYDSEQGRATAGAITALMTGEAYGASVDLAARLGPFDGYLDDREAMLRVLQMHRGALGTLDPVLAPAQITDAAEAAWDRVCARAEHVGVRNAQTTVLAPTGTISFMMDCDTTGIEPDLGLRKSKKLVGGGTLSIVNRTVPRALESLGCSPAEIDDIVAHVDDTGSMVGAPHLLDHHVAVFATSMGADPIPPGGHIAMMAAVQPFLSGAISKTVNLPEDASVDDVEQLFLDAWRTGVKAVAIYRDNCKVGQPLSVVSNVAGDESVPVREKLPRHRNSRTFEFRVADCKGFATVGEYDDGRPGEIFLRVSKQGSTLAGIMDAFAIAVSHGLQYGVPLRAFVETYVGLRFEPQGMTDDPELRIASSLVDYLFRRLAVEYMAAEERAELNIFTSDERRQPTLPGVEESTTQTVAGPDLADRSPAPICMQCGDAMVRAGACFVCGTCGSTSGCS